MTEPWEEPEQNPRIEASKRKISDALELHQHVRSMIGLNPFNILQRIKGGLQSFKAQQAQPQQCNSTSGAGCSTQSAPTGTSQVPTNTPSSPPRTQLLNLGFGILRRPQPQQAPPPPTAEQVAELDKQKKLKELEDKKKSAAEKRYRLDRLQGLSVDRT